MDLRRSLHWERGLKQFPAHFICLFHTSLPSLGAWIETPIITPGRSLGSSRSLHWERGLKLIGPDSIQGPGRVVPFIGSVD